MSKLTNREVAELIDLDSLDHEAQARLVAEVDKIEDRIQATFCRWLEKHYPKLVYFAIPNGGKRDKITANILKQTGVKKGVPDMFFAFESKKHNGFFIEVKTPIGRMSKEQKEWRHKLESESYKVYTCYGVLDCCQTVREHVDLAWDSWEDM